ncbi:MAG: transglutaminase domain-containing protein [Gemmatimonadota bacterium]|nr:MAG: transglutaminase domain-containing protein [Gemmatimonadota bacterium]
MTNHSLGSELNECLRSTHVIDSSNPQIIQFAQSVAAGESNDSDRGVALHYAVRDGVRYDPYSVDLSVSGMRASNTLPRKLGFCVPKTVLLAAAARALRIPNRLGFADVKNDLATERLLNMMQRDLFVLHGYTELYLSRRSVKATPAFNRSLRERLDVDPLAFDGIHDSVFQPPDASGNQFMQYVNDRGAFADIPLQEMQLALERHYPSLISGGNDSIRGSFNGDAISGSRR